MHVYLCTSTLNRVKKKLCVQKYTTPRHDIIRLDILLSSRPVRPGARQCRPVYPLSCMDHPKKVGSSQGPRSRHLSNSCRTAHWGGGGLSGLMPWNSGAQLWRRWTWMSPFCLLKGLVLCSWPGAVCLPRNVPFSTAGANGEPCG